MATSADPRLVPIAGGRNARVWRLDDERGRFALKRYASAERLEAEVAALELIVQAALAEVPRVEAVDRGQGTVLLTWIEGEPVTRPGPADVDCALRFLAAVHELRHAPAAQAIGPAGEACPTGAEISRQVEARLAALQAQAGEPELEEFLREEVVPVWRDARDAQEAELDTQLPTLVPADAGFHNALRRPDGTLAFYDFEYFGWDDPVKLAADVLLHPGHDLAPEQHAALRSGLTAVYGDDPGFAARLEARLPLFAVRWALILLNEFVPDRWHARVAAGIDGDWPEVKARQLARARAFLAEKA